MPSPRVKGSISNGTSVDRCEDDFYETPPAFTRALLDRQTFHSRVWEPAAGKGAISEVLAARGYAVTSTDYKPRSGLITQMDFLDGANSRYAGRFDIVTNPPFKLLVPFVETAWNLCRRKVAMVMPISGLNSSRRYEAIWSKFIVSDIYLAGRYQIINSDRGLIPSQFTHIWVVFDKEHKGDPAFHWLPNVVYSHKNA